MLNRFFWRAGASLLVSCCAVMGVTPVAAQVNAAQGTWASTLQARDLNGDNIADAYYDTALNLTWMADANWAATSQFVSGGPDPYFTPAGGMNYETATSWLTQLDYHGVTGWRLPNATFTMSASDSGCSMFFMLPPSGCTYQPDAQSNELAHLFYVTLGNTGAPDLGFGLSNVGVFHNIADANSSMLYFTGQPVETGSGWVSAFTFNLANGTAVVNPEVVPSFVWAVRDGDVGVAPVPEPETYALMLLGLAGMGAVVRRQQARRRAH